jgi:glucokinase
MAVDIGGTKIAAALVGRDGRLLDRASMPTPAGAPDSALASLRAWLREFLRGRQVAGVGVALPAVTREGRVQWVAPTLPGWGQLPLAEEIADVADAPVWCEFDGYAAAQGEVWCGAARGSGSAAVVIVGTGVGAGFLCDGHVVRGAVGVAGTVGWMRFPENGHGLGPPVESYASGPGLLRQARARQRAGSAPFRTVDDVLAAAAAGDVAAERAIARATTALASIVLTVMSTFAPEIIVLSGGVGSRPDMIGRVKKLVANAGHPFSGTRTAIAASALAGLSSLYGAGYFAYQAVDGD